MDYIEIVGFAASVLIALSMAINSKAKFRLINLVGASMFLLYGILIESWPIALLNLFIVGADIFYLLRIYTNNELFSILEVRGGNKYLINFLKFHDKEIQKFFPGFEYKPELNTISFFVLRNMAVAGVFFAHKEGSSTLKVGLDYVVPEYRDYKNAKFVYHRLNEQFKDLGITRIIVHPQSFDHIKYLKKIGFIKDEQGMFVKLLD
jgi:hypothetical protein